MRSWEKALQEHKEAVLSAGFTESNILGIFAYGSQNYGVATENSDWDTKAIIVPSYEELVLRPPVSREIKLANGEHCEIKDIREIVNMFKKQNINFIEILYTQYKWLNPTYAAQWQKYFEVNREKIAHYNIDKTVQSICGQAIHTLNQNPTNGKKVANGLRLLRFLENYLVGIKYENCIVLPKHEREEILEIKKSEKVDISFAENLSEKFLYLKQKRFGINEKQMSDIDILMRNGIFAVLDIMIFY